MAPITDKRFVLKKDDVRLEFAADDRLVLLTPEKGPYRPTSQAALSFLEQHPAVREANEDDMKAHAKAVEERKKAAAAEKEKAKSGGGS